VVKSCPSALIVGWINDDVAPSLHPSELGMFPGMVCMIPQSFATGGN
jgi:hypothetical protein